MMVTCPLYVPAASPDVFTDTVSRLPGRVSGTEAEAVSHVWSTPSENVALIGDVSPTENVWLASVLPTVPEKESGEIGLIAYGVPLLVPVLLPLPVPVLLPLPVEALDDEAGLKVIVTVTT